MSTGNPDETQPLKTEGIPYIGSKISLISKTDIRYEGILFNVDANAGTVALRDVRSFGTENRRNERIPPSDTVYHYCTFKATEIKDLKICEAAPTVAQLNDPAIVSTSSAVPVPVSVPMKSQSYANDNAGHEPKSAEIKPTNEKPVSRSVDSNRSHRVESTDSQHEGEQNKNKKTTQRNNNEAKATAQTATGPTNNKKTIPGMGGHLLHRRQRGTVSNDNKEASSTQDVNHTFDFESGIFGFNKEEEFSKLNVNEEGEESKPHGTYQKTSFFDTISCDALDRLEGRSGRLNPREERKLNTETFGAVSLNHNNYRGRGRGWGRRGGGRGGRGYGYRRGGYHQRGENQNQNQNQNQNGNGHERNYQKNNENSNRWHEKSKEQQQKRQS